MDGDPWSFGAFWVLPTKDSCSTEIGGLNSNGNCDELDGNGEINCRIEGLTVMEGSMATAMVMNSMAMERAKLCQPPPSCGASSTFFRWAAVPFC